MVWRHEENHAFEQQAQVERLVTLSGACFHLNKKREKQRGGEEQCECQCEGSGEIKSPGQKKGEELKEGGLYGNEWDPAQYHDVLTYQIMKMCS